MVAAGAGRAASKSRRWRVAVLPWLCLACGCLGPSEPHLATLARARRATAGDLERERRQRELAIAEQEARDLLAAITAAKAESVRAAAALRAVRAELLQQLEQLQAAERDLAAARTRQQQIEAEAATDAPPATDAPR
ncbi:MAG: hypothetical protein JNL08_01335 [Planctomycetes bacterium]|nr:hypothetical protein [Planctomycetota bacterium]